MEREREREVEFHLPVTGSFLGVHNSYALLVLSFMRNDGVST